MRAAYLLVIAGLLAVLGLLLYPTVNYINGLVDTTGFLPLLTAATAALPCAFLGFVVYAIFRAYKR